jgi:hypothetical protein
MRSGQSRAAGTIYDVPAIHVQKHFDLYERDSSTVILVAKLNRPSDGSHRPYPWGFGKMRKSGLLCLCQLMQSCTIYKSKKSHATTGLCCPWLTCQGASFALKFSMQSIYSNRHPISTVWSKIKILDGLLHKPVCTLFFGQIPCAPLKRVACLINPSKF